MINNTTSYNFKATTKFRVIFGMASFFTTTKQIRQGVGSHSAFNKAVLSALSALEKMQSDTSKPVGLSGYWEGINVQIDIIK